jgi:hypothetical protein
MNRRTMHVWALAGVVTVLGWQLNGCSIAPLIPINVPLSGGLASYDVQADEAAKSSGTANFDTGGIQVGRGTLELDPSAITVTPAEASSSKGNVTFQATSTLEITVWIASADLADTVCETGEQYGPFSVTLDENYVPTAISPSSVTLSQNTVDLLNAGEFALCIEVLSPVTGTVTINSMTLNLGL